MLLNFCWNLALQLINNIYIRERKGGGAGVELLLDPINRFITAPRHTRRYQNYRCICTVKPVNQQYNCSFKCGNG